MYMFSKALAAAAELFVVESYCWCAYCDNYDLDTWVTDALTLHNDLQASSTASGTVYQNMLHSA